MKTIKIYAGETVTDDYFKSFHQLLLVKEAYTLVKTFLLSTEDTLVIRSNENIPVSFIWYYRITKKKKRYDVELYINGVLCTGDDQLGILFDDWNRVLPYITNNTEPEEDE
jgi:hypothetical protein